MAQEDFADAAYRQNFSEIKHKIKMMTGEEKLELGLAMMRAMGGDPAKMYYPIIACARGLFSFDDLLKSLKDEDINGVATIGEAGEKKIYTAEDIDTLVLLYEAMTPGTRMNKAFEKMMAEQGGTGEDVASNPANEL